MCYGPKDDGNRSVQELVGRDHPEHQARHVGPRDITNMGESSVVANPVVPSELAIRETARPDDYPIETATANDVLHPLHVGVLVTEEGLENPTIPDGRRRVPEDTHRGQDDETSDSIPLHRRDDGCGAVAVECHRPKGRPDPGNAEAGQDDVLPFDSAVDGAGVGQVDLSCLKSVGRTPEARWLAGYGCHLVPAGEGLLDEFAAGTPGRAENDDFHRGCLLIDPRIPSATTHTEVARPPSQSALPEPDEAHLTARRLHFKALSEGRSSGSPPADANGARGSRTRARSTGRRAPVLRGGRESR
jgi:hypothetical protein